MDTQLIGQILYYVVLYAGLSLTMIPFFFFLFWNFLNFWKKRGAWFFYAFMVTFFVAGILAFVLTQDRWILWYYAFPQWVQILGLCVAIVSGIIIKMAEIKITRAVRFFRPVIKGEKFQLQTDGAYRYVRHPIYAVFPWYAFGVLLYTGQLILLPIFVFNMLARTWYAKKEEAYLAGHVTGDYEKFKRQTPNRFYPSFGKRVKHS